MEPLFLKGVLHTKIWGGTKLRDEFSYEIPSDKTGEYWAISAHPNGPSIVTNGEFVGKNLAELWDSNRELFGNQSGAVFPLLTKIIDAQDNLSVQVHPDDEYSLKHEGELGKTECWYILAADDNSEIILGHNANSPEQFQNYIKEGKWNELLSSIKVKSGDFFFVPSGTVHAIGKGVMVLETQQSSDTTYRLYDYDRVDTDGNARDLHIKDSIAVSTIPHENSSNEFKISKTKNSVMRTLVSNKYFNVYDFKLNGKSTLDQESFYTLISVIEGSGNLTVEDKVYPIYKGHHFLIPNQIKSWELDGELQAIISTP